MAEPPVSGPHAGRPVLEAGAPLGGGEVGADAAILLVHGRGGSAEDMLALAGQLDMTGYALLAPSAADATWYPQSFLAPIERNEPHLSSALALLGAAVQRVVDAGVAASRLIMLGFSQGACLASEFCHRNPRRYGGLAALSGGLIGPPGIEWPQRGSLDGTPVFLGCSDRDPHIPQTRVHETAEVLSAQGAVVDARIYAGLGHTVNREELAAVQALVDALRGEGGIRP